MSGSAIARDAAARPPASTRSARRSESTRCKLLEAGAEVIARDGHHAAKVAEIARTAGVANGTFYLHFESKERLVRELARIALEDLGRRLHRVHLEGTDPEASDLAEIEALVDFAVTNRNLIAAFGGRAEPFPGDGFDPLEALTRQREREIREKQAAGTYRADVDPAIAARADASMHFGVLRWWASTGFAAHRDALVQTLHILRRSGTRP